MHAVDPGVLAHQSASKRPLIHAKLIKDLRHTRGEPFLELTVLEDRQACDHEKPKMGCGVNRFAKRSVGQGSLVFSRQNMVHLIPTMAEMGEECRHEGNQAEVRSPGHGVAQLGSAADGTDAEEPVAEADDDVVERIRAELPRCDARVEDARHLHDILRCLENILVGVSHRIDERGCDLQDGDNGNYLIQFLGRLAQLGRAPPQQCQVNVDAKSSSKRASVSMCCDKVTSPI